MTRWMAAFGLALAGGLGAVVSAAGAPDLAGVWRSETDFGTTVWASEVNVTSRNGAYVVDRVTQLDAVHRYASVPAFTLRAQKTPDGLVGQWIQGATESTGDRYATPITFTKRANGTWHGQLTPLIDVLHADLVARPADKTGAPAFILNPEQNFGARLGLRALTINGSSLSLSAPGKPALSGSFDSSSGTVTLRFPQFRRDFVFHRVPANQVAALGPAAGSDNGYRVPLASDDGWQTGSLHDSGIDERQVSDLVREIAGNRDAALSGPHIQALLIARHGRLVVDEYFEGFDRQRPHDVRSAGKSVTTMMVGVAFANQRAITPQTPVYTLFSRYAPFKNDDARKRRITVADLMTMSSGLACDDNDDASPGQEDKMQSQTMQADWYKYTLDLPMVADPGTHAVYCSAGINLLGGVVARASGQWLPDFFFDRLAKPMQFGVYHMALTPPPLDTAYMAGGDYFLPRDFLKFGQLFLNRGRWNGRQIVSDSWLQACATPRSGLNAPGDYGYGWHLLRYTVNGKTYKAIEAGGNGGQILVVVPDLDVAVLIMAGNYGQFPVWQRFITDLIPHRILAAIVH